MAVLRPSLDQCERLDPPLNDGEMRVAAALSTLDDDWTVYVQPRLGMDVPDFVAVHDTHGVCIVEVKDWSPRLYQQCDDGRIQFRSDGIWCDSDEKPRYQAFRYRSAIYDQFFAMPEDGGDATNAVRSVVIFPQFSRRDAERLLERIQVTDKEKHATVYGGEDIERGMLRIVTDKNFKKLKPASIERLRRHLVESSVLQELRLRAPLSAGAKRIADNPNDARRRRVKGAAGCGKSFGLAARAARLAAEGQHVLVLSFNVTLVHYLRSLVTARCQEIGADPKLIATTHFHGFCKRIAEDAVALGLQIDDPIEGEDYERNVRKAQQAFDLGFEQRFDAVLVDEGQDFSLEWWNMLRHHVVEPDGEMLLVADPTQDLYAQRAWTDEDRMIGAGFSGQWTELKGSYRMPSDIVPLANRFAADFLDGERIGATIPDDRDEISGISSTTRRRWTNIASSHSLGTTIGEEVVRLLQEQPMLCPSDVVFLCGSHDDGLDAVQVIEAAGHDVHHVFARNDFESGRRKRRFWPDAPGVKGCTVHSFKGWETKALVMGIGGGNEWKRLAYVAMTRVKADSTDGLSFLSVVNSQRSVDGFQATFEQWAPPLAALRVG